MTRVFRFCHAIPRSTTSIKQSFLSLWYGFTMLSVIAVVNIAYIVEVGSTRYTYRKMKGRAIHEVWVIGFRL